MRAPNFPHQIMRGECKINTINGHNQITLAGGSDCNHTLEHNPGAAVVLVRILSGPTQNPEVPHDWSSGFWLVPSLLKILGAPCSQVGSWERLVPRGDPGGATVVPRILTLPVSVQDPERTVQDPEGPFSPGVGSTGSCCDRTVAI